MNSVKLLIHGLRAIKSHFFRKKSIAEKQRKSKKTPDSTIGFLEYGTRKTIVLGQKTSKNMNSVKMLIHGRRSIKSHFSQKFDC